MLTCGLCCLAFNFLLGLSPGLSVPARQGEASGAGVAEADEKQWGMKQSKRIVCFQHTTSGKRTTWKHEQAIRLPSPRRDRLSAASGAKRWEKTQIVIIIILSQHS